MQVITFGTGDPYFLEANNLHPQPIKKYMPDWYKSIGINLPDVSEIYTGMHDYERNNRYRTVKSCPSFVEMWEEGFVIPAPTDYILRWKDDELYWRSRLSFAKDKFSEQEVTNHWNSQMVDYIPKEAGIRVVVKLNTPLKVFTPKGYSVRQLPIPFTFNRKWSAVEGVLRTDKIHSVNVQIYLKTDEEVIIKQGEPICYYVPFKREKFAMNFIDLNKKNPITRLYKKNSITTYGKFKMDLKGY